MKNKRLLSLSVSLCFQTLQYEKFGLILRVVENVEFGLTGPQHDCYIFSLYLSNKAVLKNRKLLIDHSLKVSVERFAFTTESICNAYNITCISVMR